jgi:hypothetical protein
VWLANMGGTKRMSKKKINKADELLKRIFKMISYSHFGDHKLSPSYLADIRFDRGVGEDVASWVQAYHPEYYQLKRKEFIKYKQNEQKEK